MHIIHRLYTDYMQIVCIICTFYHVQNVSKGYSIFVQSIGKLYESYIITQIRLCSIYANYNIVSKVPAYPRRAKQANNMQRAHFMCSACNMQENQMQEICKIMQYM